MNELFSSAGLASQFLCGSASWVSKLGQLAQAAPFHMSVCVELTISLKFPVTDNSFNS